MKAETKILGTTTSEHYEVRAFDGKEWGTLSGSLKEAHSIEEAKSLTKHSFDTGAEALEFASKSLKMFKNEFKEVKVVKVTEVKSTVVTTMEDEDNYITIS